VVHEVDVESIVLQDTHSSVTVAISSQSSSSSSGSSSGPGSGFGKGLGSLEAANPPPPQFFRQGPWQKMGSKQGISHFARLIQGGPFFLSEALE
jgi:hypothetical protein